MTCPHCGFENTEDRQACFRCGQVLDLSGVEVIPPRLRRGKPGNPAMETWTVWWNRHHPGRRAVEHVSALAIFLASLVPGLGHFLLGEVRLAGWLALLWLVSALGTMLAEPPASYRPLLVWDWLFQPRWIPLSVHAWILADAYSRRVRLSGRGVRMGETAVVTLAAVVLLTAPNTLGLMPGHDRFAQVAVQVSLPEGGLLPGDRVLVDRGRVPEALPVGTMVLYRGPWIEVEGEMLGVVLAGPGTHLQWRADSATLLRDGRVVHLEGLSAMRDGEVDLGEGQRVVLPAHRAAVRELQELVLAAEEIRGVAVETVWPPERRRILSTR